MERKYRTSVNGAGVRPTRPGGPESGFKPNNEASRPLQQRVELLTWRGKVSTESDIAVILPLDNNPLEAELAIQLSTQTAED